MRVERHLLTPFGIHRVKRLESEQEDVLKKELPIHFCQQYTKLGWSGRKPLLPLLAGKGPV